MSPTRSFRQSAVRRAIAGVLVAGAALTLSGPARSVDWNNPAGGAYDDPGNWLPVGVPTPAQGVRFGLGVSLLTPYVVTFSGDVTQNDLDILNDAVAFDLGGHTYTTGSETWISATATDNSYFVVANGSLDIGGDLRVAEAGNGALNIINGGMVANDFGYIGRAAGSSGAVFVDGVGSSWNNSGEVSIGRSGTGSLSIINGAQATNTNGYIGYFGGTTPSSGTVSVDGAGSSWTNSGDLYAGRNGLADLTISNGGLVTNVDGYIGRFATGDGTVTVNSAGTWSSSGSLYIAGDATVAGGTGVLDVQDGGTVNVADTLKLWTGGTLNLSGGSINTSSFDGAEGTFNFTAGTMTVDGGSYTSPATIDTDATLELVNGASASMSSFSSAVRGILNVYSGSSANIESNIIGGVVTIDGAGSSAILDTDMMGTVNIQNGASATAQTLIIGQGSDAGYIYVDGVGSSLTTTNSLHLGNEDFGALSVTGGGHVSSASTWIGSSGGDFGRGNGRATVTGEGSSWIINGLMRIGVDGGINSDARGRLEILDGGYVSSLGAFMEYVPSVKVDGAQSRWINDGNIEIIDAIENTQPRFSINAGLVDNSNGYIDIRERDFSAVQDLLVENGGSLINTDAFLRSIAGLGSETKATVTGLNSTWTSTGSMYLGGTDLTAEGGAILEVLNGATVTVNGLLKTWELGAVEINGGSLDVGDIENLGSFSFTRGSLSMGGDFTVGAAGLLGSGVTLTASRLLNVGGTTRIDPFDSLVLDGGSFSTGALANAGTFDFRRGELNLTASGMTIGSGGLFGQSLALDSSRTINVSGAVDIAGDGILALTDGRLSGGSINNAGFISLSGPLAALDGGILNNTGLLVGSGRIGSSLSNGETGEVRVTAGNSLTFNAVNNTNAGTVRLLGGIAEFTGALTNSKTGQVLGNGVMIADGGLANQGEMSFSGLSTDVFGDVNHTGRLRVSGNSVATFYNDFVNNGSEFRVSSGSTAVFFGAYSGGSSISGLGTVLFDGTVNFGNSPGRVSIGGDVLFSSDNVLTVELAGTEPGIEYDQLLVGGKLVLGGTLQFVLLDDFVPADGDVFEALIADGGLSGDFAEVFLPQVAGYEFQLLRDARSLSLAAQVTPVPLPAAAWLFLGALGFLATRAGRRRVH